MFKTLLYSMHFGRLSKERSVLYFHLTVHLAVLHSTTNYTRVSRCYLIKVPDEADVELSLASRVTLYGDKPLFMKTSRSDLCQL